MEDLISRQAAIDEIMKELKDRSLHDDEETSEDFADGYDEGIRNAATKVYLMPSAQTEIIHCKECEYGMQDDNGNWYCHGLGCTIGSKDGSGFCADAERK